MIADTNYIMDLIQEKQRAKNKIKKIKNKNTTQKLCTPVIYELLAGIEYIGSKKEKIQLNSLIKKFPILEFDVESAKICSKIDAELRKERKKLGQIDKQIASIALSNKETLLTNDNGFKIIEELFDLETEKY